MPLTFRKRIKICRWLYLNIGKRSVSITTKAGPVSVNHRRGRTRRVSVNGPWGFGWRAGGRSTRSRPPEGSQGPSGPAEVAVWGSPSEDVAERPVMPPEGFDPRR